MILTYYLKDQLAFIPWEHVSHVQVGRLRAQRV